MRYIFLYILLIGLSTAAYGQAAQGKPDSLMQALDAAKEDTNKVLLLFKIANHYSPTDPGTAINYGKDALQLSQKLEWQNGIQKSYSTIGIQYAMMNDYVTALEYFNHALFTAKKIGEKSSIIKLLTNIGLLYTNKGDFDKALDYYKQAKVESTDAGIPPNAQSILNFGVLYFRKKDYKEALKYFEQALAQSIEEKVSPSDISQIHSNISVVYGKFNQYDKALYHSFKALENTGDAKFVQSMTLNNIANTYTLLYSYDGINTLPDSLRNKTLNLNKAIRYYQASLEIAKSINSLDNMQRIYHGMSNTYELMGDYKTALKNHREYAEIADSLLHLNKEKDFARVEAEFKVQQTTDSLKYVASLHAGEVAKKKLERNIIVLVIVFICVVVVLLINRQKLKHQQKLKIVESEKTVAEELAKAKLADFAQRIQEKNQLIEAITEEIEKYKQVYGVEHIVDYGLLKELQESILLTDTQWENFKNTFDRVYTGYTIRLKQKLPDISPAETRFILLSKLNLTNKEMGAMLGVSPQAMRANKYRLMKKLELEDDVLLDELIETI